VEKRKLLCTVGGNVYKLVQPLWKIVWRALKKLEIVAIPLLGIYLKKMKTPI